MNLSELVEWFHDFEIDLEMPYRFAGPSGTSMALLLNCAWHEVFGRPGVLTQAEVDQCRTRVNAIVDAGPM